jgi:hypothetical protein
MTALPGRRSLYSSDCSFALVLLLLLLSLMILLTQTLMTCYTTRPASQPFLAFSLLAAEDAEPCSFCRLCHLSFCGFLSVGIESGAVNLEIQNETDGWTDGRV